MGVFDLPSDFWICQDCGVKWNEDNAKTCPRCESENIKKEKH